MCDGRDGLFLLSVNEVWKMTPGGAPCKVAGVGSQAGAAAVAPDGSIYIGDKSRVFKIDTNGKKSVFADGFKEIYGVAISPNGVVCVSDWAAGVVYSVQSGKRKAVALGLEYPSGLAFDIEGNLYVKESGRQVNKNLRIREITKGGKTRTIAEISLR